MVPHFQRAPPLLWRVGSRNWTRTGSFFCGAASKDAGSGPWAVETFRSRSRFARSHGLCHRWRMARRETERILDAVRRARAVGEPAAMAVVVRVRGSAYRREGTRMFVRMDGTYECALSGGCLEPTVAEAAARVIATGEPAIVSYDLAEDSIWGLGIGCSGAVDIRIEPVLDDAITDAWLTMLERGEAGVLVTPLYGVSGRLIVDGARVVGRLSDPVVEAWAIAHARARLGEAYPASAAERTASAELFYDVAPPPPPLVIFGAGHDAAPVADLAWNLGFTVTVVDVRDAYLAAHRFLGAVSLRAHFSEFRERVTIGPRTFVLIMNHHVERDRESLRFSLDSGAAYIGVLGPRARYDRLLAGLATTGYVPDPSRAASVRSPVGLALGAETPEEVALSIVGEMLAVLRGFEGGFLSGAAGSLHRPEASRLVARS